LSNDVKLQYLITFLENKFETTDKENKNTNTNKSENENVIDNEKDDDIKRNEDMASSKPKPKSKHLKSEKRLKWLAYTKSMQVIIISANVRKAVDTIHYLTSTIKIEHSFLHKKKKQKLLADNEELTDLELASHAEENKLIIPLRICELFGKHRRLIDQQNDLNQRSFHIGVGGSNRILKLCHLWCFSEKRYPLKTTVFEVFYY
jgi:hypothetical protein